MSPTREGSPVPADRRWFGAVVFLLVWLVAVAYLASLIDRGWGPPDEGLLGQTAERVLRGELPHRDFDEFYTGGLTALHALAFKLLGVRLLSLRLVLLGAAAVWVPLFYAAARRFAAPAGAGMVTLLAVAWSVPAYPASMPSWYNLFLATAGLLALLRYFDDGRDRWLAIAGACGGLSVSVKVVGVYFLGAAGLAVLHHALISAPEAPGSRKTAAGLGLAAAVALTSAALWLVHGAYRKSAATYLQFVLPAAVLGVILAAAAWRAGAVRWRRVLRPAGALLAGAAVALLPLLLVYASEHALGELARGLFVLPARRLRYAVFPPSTEAFAAVLPLVLAGLAARRVATRAGGILVAVLVGAAGLWLLLHGDRTPDAGGVGGDGPVFRPVMDSVAALLPVLMLAFLAFSLASRGLPVAQRARGFGVAAVAALCGLIQFPYSNDLYAHYAVPLVLLALLAVLAADPRRWNRWIVGAAAAFYLAFGVARVRVTASAPLALDRGGLRVPPGDSAAAAGFVRLLRAHARGGYTYATPDAPEAYFLSGLRNPTRLMYERLSPAVYPTEDILALLDRHGVTAVAVSRWLIASRAPDPALLDSLRRRYPDSAVAWHFTVRWK